MMLSPGLTALAVWTLSGQRDGARRPEMPLTSISALAALLCVSLITHILAFALSELGWQAAIELGRTYPAHGLGPVVASPYETALALARKSEITVVDFSVFIGVIVIQCIAIWIFITDRGLDIALDGTDLRSQGWLYHSVVRPVRHGYQPVAYVLTLPIHQDRGLGYRGVVDDVRMNQDGEIKVITLAQPEAYVYELTSKPKGLRAWFGPKDDGVHPRIRSHEAKTLTGLLTIEGPQIRNVLINQVPDSLIALVASQISEDAMETSA
ncbi:hypothetical protein [Brevundimonas sp.]|uniref:hypothetical protein n=1 Tax=Brevundimonas sp. TaxID=1871086 RepID=UPI003AFF6388